MSLPLAFPGRPARRSALPASHPRRLVAALLAALVALTAWAAPASASPQAKLAGAAVGRRIIQLARVELAKGVHEVPDGSNRAPAIRRYETATAGAMYGAPWCAYFVSYIAKRAGVPIGPGGSGMGYVPYIRAWAKQTGRWTRVPRSGELITFPEHVGIVETVYSNHTMTTIEGNAGNAVRREWRNWSEAVGYVRLAASAAKAPAPATPSPVRPPSTGPVRQRLVARITAYPGTTVAIGQRIDFTSNDSSGTIVRTEWDWDGNGHWDAHGDSASHTYTRAGTYTVRMRITDSAGHRATATATITVRSNQPPVAVLDLSATNITVGDTIHADASHSSDPDGHIVSYEWDLNGDGNYGEDGPQHDFTYDTPGDYNAGLRVTDDSGNVAETHVHVHVSDYAPPVAAPHCSPTTVTSGQTITCTSDDSGSPYHVVRHGWDVDGDGTDDLRGGTVHFSYAEPGDHQVRLTVTDSNGKTASATVDFHVTDQPPTAKIHGPHTVNLGQPVTFDATDSTDPDGTIASYAWDLDGDGIYETTGATPTFTYTTPGTYPVTLKVTDDAGNVAYASATVRVVDQGPVAKIVLPTKPAVGTDVTFDATKSTDPDGTIASYAWDLDGDGTYETTGSKPTFRYATPGTRTVRLKVTDAWGATSTATATVTILAPPVASAQVLTSSPHSGSSVQFSAAGSTDADGWITKYQWDFDGDGVIDRSQTWSTSAWWTWWTPGSFQVTLTVTDNSGLKSSTTIPVTVAP